MKQTNTIQSRFAKIFPNAKVYWNGNNNQLSWHFIDCKVNVKAVEMEAYRVLDRIGLLRAVESVRVMSY